MRAGFEQIRQGGADCRRMSRFSNDGDVWKPAFGIHHLITGAEDEGDMQFLKLLSNRVNWKAAEVHIENCGINVL